MPQKTLYGGDLYDRNIRKTKEYLRDYNEDNSLLIGFSGGKDSTVLLDLALEELPREDVYVIFEDTKIEFLETYEFVEFAINDLFEIPDER